MNEYDTNNFIDSGGQRIVSVPDQIREAIASSIPPWNWKRLLPWLGLVTRLARRPI